MVTSQQVGVGAHLVGGLKAPDADTAMRTAAGVLGDHLRAITDGETGDRSQWIWWQIGKLTALDGIDLAGTHGSEDADNEDYAEFPALAIDPSVTEIPARALGYADAAEASYETFLGLRGEGVVADDMRFQVSIPTPYATVIAWVEEDVQERFFPIYADAIAAEVAAIAEIVGPNDLSLQYDVAVEIGALTGNMPAAGKLGEKAFVTESLRDVVSRTPKGGRARGALLLRRLQAPALHGAAGPVAVRRAGQRGRRHGGLRAHAGGSRDGRKPEYFEPLRDLKASRLALGVIDYEGDEAARGSSPRRPPPAAAGVEFAVATECGMARIDERGSDGPTLERLLELHAAVAAPIR